MRKPRSILAFMRVFPEFRAESWAAWRGILARVTPDIRELFIAAGRGSGKSRVVALLACCFACREYRRAPGESTYIGIFGADRKQAAITFRYIRGLLKSVPALARLIVNETRESLELSTHVIVEVITAGKAAPRGRAYALAVIEEASMLQTDTAAADPDVEIVRAIEPALARVDGSLLAVIGTPYAPRGVLYEAWREGDADDRIVIAADTLTLNPTFRRRAIERAFVRDPVSAASEYGQDGTIAFRPDVAGLLAAVRELPPEPGRLAAGHFDAATGSGEDAAALAIAFAGTPAVLACVRQWRPPFSPARVVQEAAELCARYGIGQITIDKYAPGLVAELFRERAISCTLAARDTSAAFVELLALVNSKRITLLDDPVLLGELRRLERRPGTGGRDVVGHPPRGHDDVAAAAANALLLATAAQQVEASGFPIGIERPSRWSLGSFGGGSGTPWLSGADGLADWGR
jgi:hypothetical protein